MEDSPKGRESDSKDVGPLDPGPKEGAPALPEPTKPR